MAATQTAEIRKLRVSEFPTILAIDAESFSKRLNERELRELLKVRGVSAKVLVYQKQVLAYIIYKVTKATIEILRIAVTSKCRRKHVGSQIISWLKGTAKKSQQKRIYAQVRETNDGAIRFFDRVGFVVTGIAWDHGTWDDQTTADLFDFVYYIDWLPGELQKPANLRPSAVDEVLASDDPENTEREPRAISDS